MSIVEPKVFMMKYLRSYLPKLSLFLVQGHQGESTYRKLDCQQEKKKIKN